MQFPIHGLLNRTTWVKIHLYLALIVGFFFALMGLTGSVSVYREELDELLNPQLVIEQPLGKRQSLDKIMAAVQKAHPDRYGSWTLEMPRSPHGMITAWYDKPRETFFELYAPLMVSVNPYTAEVVASRFWGQTVTTWLLDLHTQLRLERLGWNAVGILGVLLMVSICSGVYLWWPGWRSIRDAFIAPVQRRLPARTPSLEFDAPAPGRLAANRPSLPLAAPVPGKLAAYTPSLGFAAPVPDRLAAYTPSLGFAAPAPGRLAAYTPSLVLRICFKAGMIQLAFDVHRLIGLLSAAILLLLAFTGVQLSFPSVLATLTGSSAMAHGETGRSIISTATPNNHPVALESAEFIARGPFPRAELRRVTTPAGDSGIYRINLRQGSEINHRHPYTTVWVDRWSGHIKEVRDPSGFTQGEVLMTWIWPAHTGEAFGAKGRLLWFIAGLAPFFLYVSGLLCWLYRRGIIRDRELTAAALRPLFYRVQEIIYRTGVRLFRLTTWLLDRVKQYAPRLMKAGLALWQRLLPMLFKRQKRLGKNSRG